MVWRRQNSATAAGLPSPDMDGVPEADHGTWKLDEVRLIRIGDASSSTSEPAVLRHTANIVTQPYSPEAVLNVKVDTGAAAPGPAAVDKEYDLALLGLMEDEEERKKLLAGILMQRHGLSAAQLEREKEANAFQAQRTALVGQAVKAAEEVNNHLVTWRKLAQFVVPPLMAGTVIATMVLMFRLLPLVSADMISGAELALIFFVLALVAVSPVTLLLIGRPLKGLDEWSPAKAAEPEAGGSSADTKPATETAAG